MGSQRWEAALAAFGIRSLLDLPSNSRCQIIWRYPPAVLRGAVAVRVKVSHPGPGSGSHQGGKSAAVGGRRQATFALFGISLPRQGGRSFAWEASLGVWIDSCHESTELSSSRKGEATRSRTSTRGRAKRKKKLMVKSSRAAAGSDQESDYEPDSSGAKRKRESSAAKASGAKRARQSSAGRSKPKAKLRPKARADAREVVEIADQDSDEDFVVDLDSTPKFRNKSSTSGRPKPKAKRPPAKGPGKRTGGPGKAASSGSSEDPDSSDLSDSGESVMSPHKALGRAPQTAKAKPKGAAGAMATRDSDDDSWGSDTGLRGGGGSSSSSSSSSRRKFASAIKNDRSNSSDDDSWGSSSSESEAPEARARRGKQFASRKSGAGNKRETPAAGRRQSPIKSIADRIQASVDAAEPTADVEAEEQQDEVVSDAKARGLFESPERSARPDAWMSRPSSCRTPSWRARGNDIFARKGSKSKRRFAIVLPAQMVVGEAGIGGSLWFPPGSDVPTFVLDFPDGTRLRFEGQRCAHPSAFHQPVVSPHGQERNSGRGV